MQSSKRDKLASVIIGAAAIAAMTLAQPAWAYIGPGAGLSVIGSLLAFVVAIVVAMFGFVWFPLRRMLRRRKPVRHEAAENRKSARGDGLDAPKPLRRESRA